jgi:glucose/arabinose dehydrogenase
MKHPYAPTRYRLFIVGLMILFVANVANAQTTLATGFSKTTVGTGWSEPVGTAFNQNGTKLFVWEKGGRVYVCNWNAATKVYDKQATPVLNISEEVGNWRDHGMLGFALDPNFNTNGLIYVMYVVDRHYLMNFGTGAYNAATNEYLSATIGRITRYQLITNTGNLVANTSTRSILVGETRSTGIPILYESHGIGSLAFAADGTLLASSGDAGSYNVMDPGNIAHTYYAQALTDGIIRPNENVGAFKAQMINSLDGKILRIDPVTGNGVISNPFFNAGAPRSAASRVWAMGFRNPFRFCVRPNTGSTNPLTGDIGELYIGDVGWNTFEELNIVKEAGANCGWPIFEGLKNIASYTNAITENKDELNPLYGINGCTQPYFTFQNLIKQATADNSTTVYNPCNNAIVITGGNDNRFFHRVPSLDWKHGVDSARVKRFNGNILDIAQIGTPASGVTGTPFRGNAAVAGCWYNGDMFPASFKNTYFQADYGGTWLKNLQIQFTDQVKTVSNFASGFGAIVSVTENPLDGSLFCVDLGTSSVIKVIYSNNLPPIAKITSNKTYGAAPLTVVFNGNTSTDPEGGALTYSWNFGDGTALATSVNPSHSFVTANGNPKKFVVKLTVTDPLNQTSVDSIFISANNTPPVVSIASPVKNSLYKLGPDTAYSLTAVVSDAEHAPGQLAYAWQTKLRHNNHEHPEAIDNNVNTAAVISRIGCNGDAYYWFIQLAVTDADGLMTTDSSKIFPDCSAAGPLPVILGSFTVITQDNVNIIKWTTESEINMSYFQVERSYNGLDFESIGRVSAGRTTTNISYDWKDASHISGYNYYRLKMVNIDGTYKYSFTVRVYTGKYTGNEILISPNPVHNSFILGGNFHQNGKAVIRIVDLNGKLVKMQTRDMKAGFNSFTIDKLDALHAGIYIVEVIQNNERRKAKMVKAN